MSQFPATFGHFWQFRWTYTTHNISSKLLELSLLTTLKHRTSFFPSYPQIVGAHRIPCNRIGFCETRYFLIIWVYVFTYGPLCSIVVHRFFRQNYWLLDCIWPRRSNEILKIIERHSAVMFEQVSISKFLLNLVDSFHQSKNCQLVRTNDIFSSPQWRAHVWECGFQFTILMLLMNLLT